jgi:recombination associated protein RdgC
MFKNALVYRITHWDPESIAAIEERLATSRFVECGASQPESAGWVEPRGEKHGALIESVAGQWILKLCTETKAVPSSVVKLQLEQKLDKIQQDTGRRPKGKAAKELKEGIVHELLPRAFPKRSTTLVWIDPDAKLVVIGAASLKKADNIMTRLVELIGGGFALTLLQTELSPATAMSEWLQSKEAPAGFTIDRECELKQPDSEKSTVKYARHTLEIDEVGEHIKQGKLPTQLAMTWSDRVSFVLTEAMTIKKIKLLDVVLEGVEKSGKDEGFDADVAITTGELSQLIPDLIAALGGELQRDKPAVAASPAAAPSATPSDLPPWELAAA